MEQHCMWTAWSEIATVRNTETRNDRRLEASRFEEDCFGLSVQLNNKGILGGVGGSEGELPDDICPGFDVLSFDIGGFAETT
ncbi:MAG: hypothetical protein UX47_C0006G0018 [Candidatus Collierbacteria bacterium GW2011_GWA2_46_26]|uniref:Uncharacterized protein n=1 Tax=Candidatus Collierbacteria bacterium GW2011_GWA2_46_26 TaxID=1618381 RepID=A0A0G1PK14_9BACT|nr:MAG: hypothetical protein UX47_C0006G0018 [Candidatus Collierbacteria bacterium GW2011_GWA2_46_26]